MPRPEGLRRAIRRMKRKTSRVLARRGIDGTCANDERDVQLPQHAFYLVSYPRSGNTWLLNSLVMLFGAMRSEARSSFRHYPVLYGTPRSDRFYLRAEDRVDMARPLVIKSHEEYEVHQRLYPRRKCLYLYRDPRDTLLSYYFYMKAFRTDEDVVFERIGGEGVLTAKTEQTISFDSEEFMDFLLKHASEWAAHVEAWLAAGGVFTLSYEELHRDFVDKLAAIAAYLDIQPVVELAKVEKEYVHQFRRFLTGDARQFFRKGIVGDWRNWFSEEHVGVVAAATGDLLVRLGYEKENDVGSPAASSSQAKKP
jgi:LPS sulfotransferase NodH